VDALAHVLAWKMSLSGIPADGKTTVISDGGPNTPFSQGTTVTVNRISGHRDVDSTACPGNALYGQLPQLRQQVAGLEGPVSQLALSTPSSTVVFPGQLVVTGKLTPPAGMTIPAGATVQIQDRLAAGGRTLTTLPLAADGSYAGSLPMAHNDVVRALYTGDGSLPRVAAAPVYAAVVPVLTLQASAQTVAAGSVVTLSGTVAPAKRRVVLEEQVSRRGAFRRARLIKVGVTSGGFKRDVKLARAGSYHFIVRAPADRLTAAGASASIAVGAA
jgi:hypothetical protein